MTRHRLLWALLVAAAAATVYLVHSPSGPEPARLAAGAAPDSSGSLYANPFAQGEYVEPAPPAGQQPGQPAGAGTAVFAVDANGELILDAQARSRLDVLIATLPASATMHDIRAMEAAALAGLPPQAAQKAARLLDGYIRYLKAEDELNARLAGEAASGPEAMLDELAALRRQHLGAEAADAFFAAQDAQERYRLQLVQMAADGSLSAREKLARIEALQRTLPAAAAELQADLDTARATWTMEQSVAELRRQGASEEQVRQLREQYVGADGANSISEMESQKQEWERRQQAFLQQKDAIARMSLSERQKQERMEVLLSQIYPAEEIQAARAFHRLQPAARPR